MGVVGSAPKATSVPEEVLTEAVIEEIKSRCCFVGEAIHLFASRPRSPSGSIAAGGDDAMSVDASDNSAPSESGQSGVSVDLDRPGVASSDSQSTAHPGRQVSAMRDLYARQSTATELTIKVPVPNAAPTGPGMSTTTRASLVIPGWVRERAAEVLFEDGDVDESSVAEVILDALLKVKSDRIHNFLFESYSFSYLCVS